MSVSNVYVADSMASQSLNGLVPIDVALINQFVDHAAKDHTICTVIIAIITDKGLALRSASNPDAASKVCPAPIVRWSPCFLAVTSPGEHIFLVASSIETGR